MSNPLDSVPDEVCEPHEHSKLSPVFSSKALSRAAQIFRAMGDAERLRILDLLQHRELCVMEMVEALSEKFTTVSQRLKLLHQEGLIARRREGTHIFYSLADRHVVDLIHNALEHGSELLGNSTE
jgi:ArsR family transcriptional regulator, lead/cadmium/zinc/bismuth-responsive transcriptional repressor